METFTGSIDNTYATDSDVTTLRNDLNSHSSSADGRLGSLESFTSSIDNTYATDSDVTTLRGDLNTYTSSNNSTNTNQNNRLDSIEGFTGSIDDTYATDSDVTTLRSDLNTYTSSNDSTNTNQNSRLGSLETKSGSLNTDIKSKLNTENVVSGSEFVLNSTSPITQYVDVTVTAAGGVYYIDGVEQQIISLSKGLIYRFDVSDSSVSGHPFRFSLPNNTQYTDGVTVSGTEGSSGSYVQIIVNQDTPQTLLYYCTNHNGMGNKVFVGGAGDTDSITEGSTNLYYTDSRVKSKLNTETVISGSEQVDITGTTNYNLVDGRLGSLESFTSSIDDTYASDTDVTTLRNDLNTYTSSNDSTNISQNNRLDSIESETGSYLISSDLSNLEGRADSLESFTASIDNTYATDSDVTTLRNDLNTYTSSNDTTNTSQNNRLGSLETKTGSLDTDITNLRGDLNTYTSSNETDKQGLNNRLDSIETKTGSLTTDIGTLDGRADSLESFTASIDDTYATDTDVTNLTNRVGSLETKTGSLDTTNTTQNNRLGSLETKTGSLDTTNTSQNNRLGSLESFTGSIDNTYATDSDVTTLRNDLNTYTSSNNTTNQNQDIRLTSLETESGSIRSDLNTYTSSNDSTNTSQNNRLGSLETTSGSHDGRLDSIETKTGSLTTDLSSLDGRLDTIEGGLEFTGSNVTIKGDLLVKGTETRVDSTTVEMGDNIISLNGSGAQNAGIEVRDNTSPDLLSGSLLWDGQNNYWKGGQKGSEERLLDNTDLTTLDSRLDGIEAETGSYLTSYNDEYTTGATFNTGNGVITFKRNDGDTYTVDIDGRFLDTRAQVHSELYSTGGDANDYTEFGIYRNYASNGPISNHNTILHVSQTDGNYGFQLGGSTVANGDGLYFRNFAGTDTITGSTWLQIATRDWVGDQNYLTDYNDEYTTGATFNTGNGVITFTRNDGDTFTVDIDGRFLTSYSETDTLDSVADRGSTTDQTLTMGGIVVTGASATATSIKFNESGTDVLGIRYSGNVSGNPLDIYNFQSSSLLMRIMETGVTTFSNSVTASSFIKNGGTSSEFLKADGSVDSNLYLTQHPAIASPASSNNTGRTYIQDILLDGNGHVTGLTTASETVTNTDTNYYVDGLSFDTATGVLTASVNGTTNQTVDLDGRYLTGYTETDTLSTVTSRGASTSTTLTLSGGINGLDINNGITGNNFNISGVNQLTINDPGEGIVFQGTTNVSLYVIDDTVDNIVNFGSAGEIRRNGNHVWDASDFTSTDISNWNTAYGWGNHADENYLTQHPNITAAGSSNNTGRTYIQDILLDGNGHITGITTASESVVNTDEYTTGSTFNSGTGILTFTRNDGDTYTVDMSSTLSEVTVTGGTYDGSTQTLTLTKSDGDTVDVTGFALDTDVNYYLTGATFSTSNGVITYKVKGSSDVTVDIDGRYLPLSGGTISSSNTYSLKLENSANGSGAGIEFSDNPGTGTQRGYITHYHGDGSSYGSGASIVISTNQDSMTILADGKLMYKEGIYSKPATGTGAGTRKDSNWDTAYGWGNHADENYLTGYTETDPIFTAHAVYNITSTQISNWDTAYGWGDHSTVGYLTGYTDNNDIDYISGATFNTSTGVVTGTGTGNAGFTVDIDGRYLLDTTDTFTGSLTINGDIRGNGQQLILNAGESSAYATGQTNEYVYINAEQGLEVNSETNNWTVNGWSDRKTALLRGDLLRIDGENLTKTNIQNFKTAYGWGDHSTVGYLTGYTDNNDIDYISGATFNTGTGVITGTGTGNAGFTVDIDGRFLPLTGGSLSGNLDMTGSNPMIRFIPTGTNDGAGIRFNYTNNDGVMEFWTSDDYSEPFVWRAYDVGLDGTGNYQEWMKLYQKQLYIDGESLSKTNIQNFKTAYGWGNHSTQGYITGFTDTNEFTTGATFNGGNGIITFTRNNGGDQYTVDISSTLTDVTVTGGTYNGGNQTLTLTKSNGSSIDVTGFAIDTVKHTTGATFNTSDGIVTFTKNDLTTYSVDLDGRYLRQHPTITAASSSDNGGRTYIQDILLDGNGHVTGITTATETVTNTNDIDYVSSATFNTGTGVITGTGVGNAGFTVDIDGRYLQLAGGTMSGGINMNNNNLTNVNHIQIGDPGAGEGIEWSGGNGFKIYESPNNLTNASGNLQFVVGSTRILTLGSNGESEFTDKLTLTSSTSGSTIFDIQGTSGQLFSITDDLTGDLFAVSDSSGVPILNVNANGAVTLDPLGSLYVGNNKVINGSGNIEFDGPVTTTNQGRGIYWTGYDKEGTTDSSDTAHILHTTNSGGLSGSVIEIKSHNDATDGVNFVVNGNSAVRINGNIVVHAGNYTSYQQHPTITAATSSDNTGRTYIQDILLDGMGHVTGVTTATETVTDSGNDNDIDYISGATFNTGTGVITGTGTGNAGFTVDIDGRYLTSESYTAHDNITAASSSDNTGRTYIQDILLDGNGHVTGLTTATETVTDSGNDNYYVDGLSFNTSNGILTASVNGATNQTVDLDGRYAYSSHDHNRITENATITFGTAQLQWLDQSGVGGTGLNGVAPQNPNSDWHYQMIMNHANSAGYYVQMAFDFHDDQVWFQRMENGSLEGWREFIHSGNIGSQSVSYATTAGSADQIDGVAFRNTNSGGAIDADSLNSAGITYYTGGVTNFSGNATDGALYSQVYNSSWQHQIAGDYRSGRIAVRGKNNNTWKSWRKVPCVNSTTFTNTAAVSFTHDLGTDNVIVQVYDGNGDLFFPSRVNVQGGVVEVNFETSRSGRVVVTG